MLELFLVKDLVNIKVNDQIVNKLFLKNKRFHGFRPN